MALEKRGNGYYYYEKKRIANRVVSVYCGGGELAGFREILDLDRQDEARLAIETSLSSFKQITFCH